MTIEHDTETNVITAKLTREEYDAFELGKSPGESKTALWGRVICQTIVDERAEIMASRGCPLPSIQVILA